MCSTHFRVHNSYIFVITIQFLFCFLRIIKAKYILLFCSFVNKFTILFYDLAQCRRFGYGASDLAAMSQIWLPSHRFGRLPWVWSLCYRFGRCATNLAAVPQIWPLCHRLDCCAKDLAFASDLTGLQNEEINGKYCCFAINLLLC